MTRLDPHLADRLAKLCGLFSSDHDGERASAAAMADKLLRSRGLTWKQIIAPPAAPSTTTTEEQIAFALRNGAAVLTAKEWTFVTDIADWSASLTDKQRQWLDAIVAKVRRAA